MLMFLGKIFIHVCDKFKLGTSIQLVYKFDSHDGEDHGGSRCAVTFGQSQISCLLFAFHMRAASSYITAGFRADNK